MPASTTWSPHAARQPPFELRELAERRVREASCRSTASHASRSCFVIACPVRSPTWSSRFARRAAAAREAVAAVLARELDAELLEPVDRRLAPRRSAPRRAAWSAVSCDERQTSSACCSGESSSPNAAWMPPCAFDGVVRLQRALRRERDAGAGALGGDGGGEAGGAAADHEHVEGGRSAHVGIIPDISGLHTFIRDGRRFAFTRSCASSATISSGVAGRGFAWLPAAPRPPRRRPAAGRPSGTPKSRSRSKPPRRASARVRSTASPPIASPKRATSAGHERAVELERGRQAERVHRAVRQAVGAAERLRHRVGEREARRGRARGRRARRRAAAPRAPRGRAGAASTRGSAAAISAAPGERLLVALGVRPCT